MQSNTFIEDFDTNQIAFSRFVRLAQLLQKL